MGISLEQYRSRIGNFLPNSQQKVQKMQNSKNAFDLPRHLVLLIVTAVFMKISLSQCKVFKSMNYSVQLSNPSCSLVYPICYLQVSSFCELSNFSARYLYGNRINGGSKGVKIAHLNKGPGYLKTKINDIEQSISSHRPHILGVSEANLFHDHDENDVQLPEYSLIKCPTILNPRFGYSRVVVVGVQTKMSTALFGFKWVFLERSRFSCAIHIENGRNYVRRVGEFQVTQYLTS